MLRNAESNISKTLERDFVIVASFPKPHCYDARQALVLAGEFNTLEWLSIFTMQN